MLVVETIAKICHAYFGQGKPIKAICRDLGISRKVVRKVIRSGATEFRYERESQPLPKIGPWRDRLQELLAANDGLGSETLGQRDCRWRSLTFLRSRTRSKLRLINARFGQATDALQDAQSVLALDPNDPEAHIAVAWTLISGKPGEALNFVTSAVRLNPSYPSHYILARGIALFALNRLQEPGVTI